MTDAAMIATADLDRLFRELVLCLGGIFATQEVDDDLVWQMTRSLDVIYQRHRARLLKRTIHGEVDVPERHVEPHPAIVDALARIGDWEVR